MAGLFKSLGNLFLGTPEKRENVSTLRPEQEGLYQQLVNAGKGPGGGGAFGSAADYYRNLLSDDSADYDAFAAPALRQYYQDIVPKLSEQFAGMGAGGLSSSGFRNSQTQGAVDLAERLGQIRANLRNQGAQGLANIGSMGLNNFSQNMVTQPGTPGLLGSLSEGVGNAIAQGTGMGLGRQINNWFGGTGQKVGQNTGPYGQFPKASPQIGQAGGFQMPNFGGRGY